MNISAPFIARRVATTLLTLGIAIAGFLGFSRLPVSPLAQALRELIEHSDAADAEPARL